MGNISLPLAARYLVWFVMTNHVHLLCTPQLEGSVSRMTQALARRAKRGASGRVKVPAWKGLTTHHYRVLRLWRSGRCGRDLRGMRTREVKRTQGML